MGTNPQVIDVMAQYFAVDQERLQQKVLEVINKLDSAMRGLETALSRVADLLAPLTARMNEIAAGLAGLPPHPRATGGVTLEGLSFANAPPQGLSFDPVLGYLARFEPILNALKDASERCAQKLESIAAFLAELPEKISAGASGGEGGGKSWWGDIWDIIKSVAGAAVYDGIKLRSKDIGRYFLDLLHKATGGASLGELFTNAAKRAGSLLTKVTASLGGLLPSTGAEMAVGGLGLAGGLGVIYGFYKLMTDDELYEKLRKNPAMRNRYAGLSRPDEKAVEAERERLNPTDSSSANDHSENAPGNESDPPIPPPADADAYWDAPRELIQEDASSSTYQYDPIAEGSPDYWPYDTARYANRPEQGQIPAQQTPPQAPALPGQNLGIPEPLSAYDAVAPTVMNNTYNNQTYNLNLTAPQNSDPQQLANYITRQLSYLTRNHNLSSIG